jgi:3-oxoacyl-[acyl-carrier protein] reductase
MHLQNAVAVVTGGTGGLGRRICRALGLRGVHVAACYATRQAEGEAVARQVRQLGTRAIALKVDVASPDSVQRLVEQVVREFGRIDILVNDAAYNKWVPFSQLQDLDLETWTKILDANLTGPFICSKAVAPIMREQHQGRIVNVGSIAGLHPIGSSIAYAVSKAALTHLTRCLAVALAPEVQVNCVAAGFMEGTLMSDNLSPEYRQRARQGSLLQRAADKDDVAEVVVEFCRTDSVTGQTLVVDSGRVFH